ncbi:hypothetical protein CYLTODRAFT_204805 [Cylindrobasidium torrendii FP15055 ss-10]|uniref:Uncharacterized protein n=1 Tax=Cylindrobasidium torrendii FP15055 ss-10 TaxID=1314674 RepID=A0A0D7ATV6_9AGAR|nr:hypothetical protein CYLTODRAFT_204805 [Cylindrobasidium torrendii FP15055 ss-10]
MDFEVVKSMPTTPARKRSRSQVSPQQIKQRKKQVTIKESSVARRKENTYALPDNLEIDNNSDDEEDADEDGEGFITPEQAVRKYKYVMDDFPADVQVIITAAKPFVRHWFASMNLWICTKGMPKSAAYGPVLNMWLSSGEGVPRGARKVLKKISYDPPKFEKLCKMFNYIRTDFIKNGLECVRAELGTIGIPGNKHKDIIKLEIAWLLGEDEPYHCGGLDVANRKFTKKLAFLAPWIVNSARSWMFTRKGK